jgi:hypothetical protein
MQNHMRIRSGRYDSSSSKVNILCIKKKKEKKNENIEKKDISCILQGRTSKKSVVRRTAPAKAAATTRRSLYYSIKAGWWQWHGSIRWRVIECAVCHTSGKAFRGGNRIYSASVQLYISLFVCSAFACSNTDDDCGWLLLKVTN